MSLWLVTGGAGFIGSNLAESLVQRGEQVRVLDNFSTGRPENLKTVRERVEVITGDVRDAEACRQAVKGVNFVLHQAALGSVPRSIEFPRETNDSNVNGTLNLLVAAQREGVQRLVCAGSSSVYGKNPELPKRESMAPLPLSPYAVSKLCQEHYCLAFAESYGLETVVLRYFNVYGPRQDPNSIYAAVIPRFVQAALTGEPPVIYGDGNQSRDFTFVQDCVRANLLAAQARLDGGRVFNIAANRQVTINQLWQEVKRITGSAVEARHEAGRPGEVRHSLADISRAGAVLGWKPEVPIEEGLARTVQFFRGAA